MLITKKVDLALISSNLLLLFGWNNSEMKKNSTPKLPHNINSSGLLSISILLGKKSSDNSASEMSSKNSS